MIPVVKGSALPRIFSDKLPAFTRIIHYVYPDCFYEFSPTCGRDSFVVNNEVALFSVSMAQPCDLRQYPVDTEYFLFTNSMRENISNVISSGKAHFLSRSDAQELHSFLEQRGMICVFPHVRLDHNRDLFLKLRKDLDFSNNRISPSCLMSDVRNCRKQEREKAQCYETKKNVDDFLNNIFFTMLNQQLQGMFSDLRNEPEPCNEKRKRDRDYSYKDSPQKKSRH